MTRENPSITAFKTWVFPGLVSILGMMIWQDVNEIKADVKQLMAQSNIDKTRIDNLERQIYKLPIPSEPKQEVSISRFEAVLPESKILIKKIPVKV